MRSTLPFVLLAGAVLAPIATSQSAGAGTPRFNRDVRPILSDKCFACHGPDAGHREADLRLDIAEGAAEVLDPAAPLGSVFWERVTHEDRDERMPPESSGKELAAEEREILRRWLEAGAPYEQHWSFRPLGEVTPPEIEDPAWSDNPIDRFVRRAQIDAGIDHAAEAEPAVLARRVFLDLTGIPPSPDELDAFLADRSQDRFVRLVDRLLASQRHAERLAVWWLDLVRFADTVGYHGDQEHESTPYRDYVLKAFHDNYPFDRFTREQLGGDLIDGATEEQRTASAYNRLLQTSHEGGVQPGEYLAKYAADRVRNVSAVWLGATVGCAECHDHKYDPYTQRDFYRLAAFFADIDEERMWKAPNTTPTRRLPEIDVQGVYEHERLAAVDDRLATLREQVQADQAAGRVSPAKREIIKLEKERVELEQARRKVMVTQALAEPRITRVLARGNWMDESGEVVSPGAPACLPPLDVGERRANRLDLAAWLTRPDHPQTARVVVNRLWALLFGRGLSTTLADNGSQGDWPSHPELLDWLARDFIDSGWDLRHVIRTIVTSRTWRQASLPRPGLAAVDPANELLAHQNRRRLEAEFVRDTMLYVSGLLVEGPLGGPSVKPAQPAGLYAHLNFPPREYQAMHDARQYRRGVYVHWQRMFLHPMLKAFDGPTREECTAERAVSNTPLQALTLLNDPCFVEAARHFAARALDEEHPDDAARLAAMWSRCTGRRPHVAEIDELRSLLVAERRHYAAHPEAAESLMKVGDAPWPGRHDLGEVAAWTTVARALLNLHETITRS